MVVTKSRKSKSIKSKKFRNKKTKKVGKMRGGSQVIYNPNLPVNFSRLSTGISRQGIPNPEEYVKGINLQAAKQQQQSVFNPQSVVGMRPSMMAKLTPLQSFKTPGGINPSTSTFKSKGVRRGDKLSSKMTSMSGMSGKSFKS